MFMDHFSSSCDRRVWKKRLWAHAEALIAQLEKELIRVFKIRFIRMTLVLETYLLYLPITRFLIIKT